MLTGQCTAFSHYRQRPTTGISGTWNLNEGRRRHYLVGRRHHNINNNNGGGGGHYLVRRRPAGDNAPRSRGDGGLVRHAARYVPPVIAASTTRLHQRQQQSDDETSNKENEEDDDEEEEEEEEDEDEPVVDQEEEDDGQSTFRSSSSSTTTTTNTTTTPPPPSPPTRTGGRRRFRRALPFQDDALDRRILQTAVPSILNLAVVPVVNSVDTFWVGRLGAALALAGQSAANQVSFTVFFLIAFVPSITAPLVASAVAAGGDPQAAQDRVSESLWLCWVLGSIGTLALVIFPRTILTWLLLPTDAPALDYAAPYLRWRALGMVPSLMAATGSAAYRGLLDTVTPLKVSLTTNLVNLVLDPLFMFGLGGAGGGGHGPGGIVIVRGMGYVGAAVATAASESLGGVVYLRLLLKRKLTRWRLLLRPPSMKALLPLLQGGAAMLLRQVALNAGFLVATRRAQQMDPTGVAGAAYGITMQIYSIGIICLVGMQNAAAALVPSFRAGGSTTVAKNNGDGEEDGQDGIAQARACADRLLSWSTLAGIALGVLQFILLPFLVPLFSTLPKVQDAVFIPSLIASLIHVVNGPILAGEGILIGTGSYRALALITSTWIATMMALLTWTPLGKRLDGIMWSILLSSIVQAVGVVGHYLTMGPLAVKKATKINGAH